MSRGAITNGYAETNIQQVLLPAIYFSVSAALDSFCVVEDVLITAEHFQLLRPTEGGQGE